MSGANALAVALPDPSLPLVDGEGRLLPAWIPIFRNLLNRTGGSPGVSSDVLQQQVVEQQVVVEDLGLAGVLGLGVEAWPGEAAEALPAAVEVGSGAVDLLLAGIVGSLA